MEKKIREYEKYIAEQTAHKLTNAEKAKLAEIHRETVANFQHERLVHLIIMFFFVALAIVAVIIASYEFCKNGFLAELIPFYLLAALLVILSFFYVKHYYFLENHIQGLYKYTRILRDYSQDKIDKK